LTSCEVDSEIIATDGVDEPEPRNIHGSYEGDWYAVSMLIANPGTTTDNQGTSSPVPVPASPLDLATEELPRPRFIGLSRRAKGVLTNIGSNLVESRSFSLMSVAEPESGDVRFTASHPRIFVSRGTHNLYVDSGTKTPPKFDPDTPFPIEVIDVCAWNERYDYILSEYEGLTEKVGDTVDKGKRAGISAAKVLTGAAVLGPFGAFAGLIASAMEGLSDPGPDVPQKPPPPPDVVPDEPPRENAQDGASDFGTVAAPESLVPELNLDATIGAQALRVVPWGMDEYPHRLVDRAAPSQPWWEPDGQHLTGYQGRWGARVERDPFERRSGIRSPSFEATFLNAVLQLPNI